MNLVISSRAQFNFVWLFAIIAGGAILFLAIYGAVQSSNTGQQVTNTLTARSLASLTDPLQAGFADGSLGILSFAEETRLDISCLADGLGSTRLSVTSRTDPNSEWSSAGIDVDIPSKYLFMTQGHSAKEFTAFSKPFSFPYKVADMNILIEKDYCLLGVPASVKEDLLRLRPPNIGFDSCNASSPVRVCFTGHNAGCDIKITCSDASCNSGTLERSAKQVGFVGNLLYAAIFSDTELYECNVKRLTNRAALLANQAMEKSDLLNARDCATSLKPELFLFSNGLESAKTKDLPRLYTLAGDLDRKNKITRCKLWQ